MDRRRFNSMCTGLIAGAAAIHTKADALTTPYPESQLIHTNGTSVTLSSLAVGEAFIFSYPFLTTPCFLVRLDGSSPGKGAWPGGLDEDQSVVAFSAICSHKMSHPAKPISHISYRSKPVTFYDSSGERQTREGVISCCSERSVYDPASAGLVLAGPAPMPLAAITLRANNKGEISAVGSVGPDQYDRFLEKFGFRLAMEYGVSDIRARSGRQVEAILASDFSKQQVLC